MTVKNEPVTFVEVARKQESEMVELSGVPVEMGTEHLHGEQPSAAGEGVNNFRMPHGKSFEDIMMSEPTYCEWALRTIEQKPDT